MREVDSISSDQLHGLCWDLIVIALVENKPQRLEKTVAKQVVKLGFLLEDQPENPLGDFCEMAVLRTIFRSGEKIKI